MHTAPVSAVSYDPATTRYSSPAWRYAGCILSGNGIPRRVPDVKTQGTADRRST